MDGRGTSKVCGECSFNAVNDKHAGVWIFSVRCELSWNTKYFLVEAECPQSHVSLSLSTCLLKKQNIFFTTIKTYYSDSEENNGLFLAQFRNNRRSNSEFKTERTMLFSSPKWFIFCLCNYGKAFGIFSKLSYVSKKVALNHKIWKTNLCCDVLWWFWGLSQQNLSIFTT